MDGALITANWKMHKTPREAAAFVWELARHVRRKPLRCRVVLAPAFPLLPAVAEALRKERLPAALAAQDVSPHNEGAFTGEVSLGMLRAVGVSYVIVGHSERRRLFGETDADVARKMHAVLEAPRMTPIVCIGEPLGPRRGGRVKDYLRKQLGGLFGKNFQRRLLSRVVLAYEPVWAIGTGRSATPGDASEAHLFIERWCERRLAARPRKILYGGSVSPGNAKNLLSAPGVDGFLVGGASLRAKPFARILAAASSV
ncbi:MAG: triose-phosphate isomerase [Acidobacteriota bacterium]|nr:MAG: triose-phosphate isomerase [Acidobacteriota bacterium]